MAPAELSELLVLLTPGHSGPLGQWPIGKYSCKFSGQSVFFPPYIAYAG